MDIYLQRLRKALPEEYNEMINYYDCWLAGGAILSLVMDAEINDFDIYFKTKYDAYEFFEELGGLRSTTVTSITDKSIVCQKHYGGTTLVFNLIIFKYFDTALDIFKDFDFSCCKAAWTGKKFIYDPKFFPDVASRRIIYTPQFRYPIASLLRLYKYQKKGFTISRNEMLKIIFQVTQHPIDTLEKLEEELGSHYGMSLKKIYPEGEDFSVPRLIEVLSNLDDDLFTLTEDAKTYEEKDLPKDFREVKKEIESKKFNELLPKSLEYYDEKYCIVVPEGTGDIDEEGRNLKHCVGSYISNVLKGKSRILFLREVGKEDQSLVTIEIKRRGVKAAKGEKNRDLSEQEMKFLVEYCKEKGFNISPKSLVRNFIF